MSWEKLSLHCWAFTWLNDCANDDEADITFVQTRKTQSLYYLGFVYCHFYVCKRIKALLGTKEKKKKKKDVWMHQGRNWHSKKLSFLLIWKQNKKQNKTKQNKSKNKNKNKKQKQKQTQKTKKKQKTKQNKTKKHVQHATHYSSRPNSSLKLIAFLWKKQGNLNNRK